MKVSTTYKKAIWTVCLTYLLLLLFPLIYLSFYSFPVVDDFQYAAENRDLGLIKSQVAWYMNWTGRYTASFLISLNPVYWQWFDTYFIAPILVISIFCLSVYYFISSLGIFSSTYRFLVYVVVLAVYLTNMHTLGQAFYWMAGALTYTSGTILLLVTWGYIIRLYQVVQPVHFSTYLWLALLLFLLSGTSELIFFYNCYITFAFAVYTYLYKKEKWRLLFFVLVLSVLFGIGSAAAPGNMIRQGEVAINPFMAIYTALWATLKMWGPHYLFDLPFLCTLLLVAFVPLRNKAVEEQVRNFNVHPLLFFSVLFGGFFISFLPPSLANEGIGPRTLNFNYFVFLVAFLSSSLYAVHYYKLHGLMVTDRMPKKRFMALIILVPFLTLLYPNNTIALAYQDIVSGNARTYNKEMWDRLAYLEQVKGSPKVYVKPLSQIPHSYFKVDVGPGVGNWRNNGYEYYFKIDTVLAEQPVQQIIEAGK